MWFDWSRHQSIYLGQLDPKPLVYKIFEFVNHLQMNSKRNSACPTIGTTSLFLFIYFLVNIYFLMNLKMLQSPPLCDDFRDGTPDV